MRRRWMGRHRWLGDRWRRWRGRDKGEGDFGALNFLDGDDLLVGIGLAIVTVVIGLLAVWLLVPLLLVLVDIVVVVLVVVIGIAGRVALGRPWTIEAIGDSGESQTWAVKGWKRSDTVIAAVRRALQDGTSAMDAARRAGALANGPRVRSRLVNDVERPVV